MKKQINLLILLVMCFILSENSTQAQTKKHKGKKIRTEEVLRVCEGVAPEDRPRVSVGSFSVTKVKAKSEIGEELSTMLMNALQETQCFQVLESATKMDDVFNELDLANSQYSDENQSAQLGKMMGAQLIVSGEITEYKTGGTKVLGIGANTAHIGFILKFIDPQERKIVWTKSVERKVTKPAVKVLGANLAVFGSRAMGDAVEESVIEAVDLILNKKEIFEEYQSKRETEMEFINSTFTINVLETDYAQLSKVEKAVKSILGVELIKKNLREGSGIISVRFEGSAEALADKIMASSSPRMSIQGLDGNVIDLKVQ